MLNVKQAMVLAAGRGDRLRPLTDHIPKPLVEVRGRTLIDRQLDLLAEAHIEQAVVNISYLGHLIEAHLAGRTAPRIVFSPEEQALETGGGIVRALGYLGEEPFYALNGDVILVNGPQMPALARLAEAWHDRFDALLLLIPTTQATGYSGDGDFYLNEDGCLRRKLPGQEAPYVFTGVQLLHPRFFKDAPGGKFSLNLLYDAHRHPDGTLPNIGGLAHDGRWLHVGDLRGKTLAEEVLEAA